MRPTGSAIQGWLYRREDPAMGTVVDIHGGPTYHLENRFDALAQYLLRRGFNVLAAQLSRQHRLRPALPGGDPEAGLGRRGAGGYRAAASPS